MTKISLLIGAALAAAFSAPVFAHEDGKTGPHAIDHAPIGVMADHRHKAGEWMVSTTNITRYSNRYENGYAHGRRYVRLVRSHHFDGYDQLS